MALEENLLDRVITACGPAAFSESGVAVDPASDGERAYIRSHFLVRKLGLKDGPALSDAIDAAFDAYPNQGERLLRPVLYYLLVKFFGLEAKL
jgi:hypothetical protein